MEEIEIWKSLVFLGYPDYMVSNMGKVKSLKFGKEKILRQCKLKDGYLYVRLSKNNKQKTFKVHRLVAQMFIPNPYNLPQVNHKNEIKTDNHVSNLEWVTPKENMNYGTRNERVSKAKYKPILQYTKDMIFIRDWDSITTASKELNINLGHISSCCNFKRKTAGKYIWRFK